MAIIIVKGGAYMAQATFSIRMDEALKRGLMNCAASSA